MIIATIDTHLFGIFSQKRVGQSGKLFTIYKIRTMKGVYTTSVTSSRMKITALGSFFRKYKIDELPQLLNILKGDMSFVGPRPDVEKYYETLNLQEKNFLSIKPGITGPAQLKYRNEEELLFQQNNPESYYAEIIWKDKVRINNQYAESISFRKDICYLIKTIFSVFS